MEKNIEGPCILYGLFNLLILADNQMRLPYQEFITQRLYLARMNIGLGLEWTSDLVFLSYNYAFHVFSVPCWRLKFI